MVSQKIASHYSQRGRNMVIGRGEKDPHSSARNQAFLE